MACDCGDTSLLADAFRVRNGAEDRAFIGWTVVIADSEGTENWTQRLFERLSACDTLEDAIAYANDPDDNPATDDRVQQVGGEGVEPAVYGDLLFKLHGVYLGTGTQWFR